MSLSTHLRVAVESIRCFTDDGKLDVGELNYLLGLAKADGHVDDEEKRVLVSIITKATEAGVDAGTARRIRQVTEELGLAAPSTRRRV